MTKLERRIERLYENIKKYELQIVEIEKEYYEVKIENLKSELSDALQNNDNEEISRIAYKIHHAGEIATHNIKGLRERRHAAYDTIIELESLIED